MGKSIHALSNFKNYVALVKKRYILVLFHDGIRGVLDRDLHVIIVVEGCEKIFLSLSVINWAPGVDIVLLRMHFTVMISAVLVLCPPG